MENKLVKYIFNGVIYSSIFAFLMIGGIGFMIWEMPNDILLMYRVVLTVGLLFTIVFYVTTTYLD